MKIKKLIKASGFSQRFLPNRNNWFSYFFGLMFSFENMIINKNIVGAWVSIILSCFFPKLLPLFFIFVFFAIYRQNELVAKETDENIVRQIVYSIQVDHLASIEHEIDKAPTLLYSEYKKHSLLYWSKHYQKQQAHSLLVKLMKKYPKDEIS